MNGCMGWVGMGGQEKGREGEGDKKMPVVQCIFRIFLPYYSK